MKKIITQISEIMSRAFADCGYDAEYGAVTVSNRPDLCQYQCNGAMAAAKKYHKAPVLIANEAVAAADGAEIFTATAVAPGFINITLNSEFLANYVFAMGGAESFGVEPAENPKTIVIDYGGANVAKPLHVGHLRPAVIGESIKNILRYRGHKVIGDAHLGDWGLPIGLIITELKRRQPELPYFDPDYTGEYPKEAPFTVAELEEIYPFASQYSKEEGHEEYRDAARRAILDLQKGNRGYHALWEHIMTVSMKDLKANYEDKLNVHFDLWKKESDAQPYIPDMIDGMNKGGYTRISEGALVVDVKEESDTKEIPPCMILKSDGATLYNTTDLATIVERMKLFDPDQIVYVVDKRQDLYFEQIFRCSRKTGLVKPDTELTFIGFGTMNGKDGKPFKTRDGGVMRLETLVGNIDDEVLAKMADRDFPEEEKRQIAKTVGLAALKYGDLSNQASKDYIFDIERFTSFDGNTGPYILYTMVRIKSILAKLGTIPEAVKTAAVRERGAEETALLLTVTRFADTVEKAEAELAPHKICQFLYELADNFNGFYHANKIVGEPDEAKRNEWITILRIALAIFGDGIRMLGFEAPDRM
ncbi:MAG: arginine--tRNA ligase [Lachnospiraceae bacterium]|nr:arginine--tRNA ligase [Lachnospiraceae bacterium]